MKRQAAMLLSVLPCLLGAGAVAADLPKEGKYDHHDCYAGPHYMITHSKDQLGGSYTLNGVTVTNPGNPFYNTLNVCNGAWTQVDGEYNEIGSCEYTDASGDKFFGVYSRKNQENGTVRVVGGTGKFAGMALTGLWMPVTDTPQPAGQIVVCTHEWGSWKLP